MQMMRFVKACHVELPKTYTLLSNRTCLAGKVLHEWRCISLLSTNQWFVNMFPWPFQQKDLLLTYVETWECILVICTDLGRIRIFKSFRERSCCWLFRSREPFMEGHSVIVFDVFQCLHCDGMMTWLGFWPIFRAVLVAGRVLVSKEWLSSKQQTARRAGSFFHGYLT